MQSLKIKTTLRILTTVFAVIPMLIVGIVGYFSMTGFAANSVSQFARAAGAAQQEIINQYINECISDVAYLSLSRPAGTLAQSGQGDDAKSMLSLIAENIADRNSGFKNLEQISDHPLEENLAILKKLKENYPTKIIVSSIMGESEDEWTALARLSEEAGVDMIECNFSCPQMTSHSNGLCRLWGAR